MMNYQKISKYDTANGPGIRTTLWISGCLHGCPGCHNPQTWDITSGNLFDHNAYMEILDSLSPDYISGLTLSGGDPLHPENRSAVAALLSLVRKEYPNKSIWIYTGYTWEELLKDKKCNNIHTILSICDVLVDGRFILDKKDISLPYCGSSNQRVINVKESLNHNKIVLYT